MALGSQICPWPTFKIRTLLHQILRKLCFFKNPVEGHDETINFITYHQSIKSFLIIFLKVYFDSKKQEQWTQASILTIKSDTSKIWWIYKVYQKYTINICLINSGFSKFLSWTLSSSSCFFLSLCMCISIYKLSNL